MSRRPEPMSLERVRELIGEPSEAAEAKVWDHVDRHVHRFIAHSPFVCVATAHTDGTADCSPRGDHPGFVKVLDPRTTFPEVTPPGVLYTAGGIGITAVPAMFVRDVRRGHEPTLLYAGRSLTRTLVLDLRVGMLPAWTPSRSSPNGLPRRSGAVWPSTTSTFVCWGPARISETPTPCG